MMSEQIKTWTKEAEQLSSEVKKFISNAKVCVKSDTVEENVLQQKKLELTDKIDALKSTIKEHQADSDISDAKLTVSREKLMEKLDAQKAKVLSTPTSAEKKEKNSGDKKKIKAEADKEHKSKGDIKLKEPKTDAKGSKLNKSQKQHTKTIKSDGDSSKERKKKNEIPQITTTTTTTTTTDTTTPTPETNRKTGSLKKPKEKDASKKQDSNSEKKEKKSKTSDKEKSKKSLKDSPSVTEETQDKEKVKKHDEKLASDSSVSKSKKEKKAKKDKSEKKLSNEISTETLEKSRALTEKLSQEPTEVSELPSDVDAPSTFHTETDLVTEDVISDLEDDSFVVDHVSVQHAQAKPQERKLQGILKKSAISEKTDELQLIQSGSQMKPVVSSDRLGEMYVTIRGWSGEEETDLSFEQGCSLKVLEKQEDGWWLAEDGSGKTGLVPMNFLKPMELQQEENKSDVRGDRKALVQEAFSEVFELEDQSESKEQAGTQGVDHEETGTQKTTKVVSDTKWTDPKERERVAREAFAEVFLLEEEELNQVAKPDHTGTVTKVAPAEPDDTETIGMAASLYDEDTFTLDELVEENLTEKSESQANAAIRSRDSAAADDVELTEQAVSVKQRVTQWEQKVTMHGDTVEKPQNKQKEMKVQPVKKCGKKTEQESVDMEKEEDKNKLDEESEVEEEDEEEEEETDEEIATEFNKEIAIAAKRAGTEDEDEDEDDEEITELSENEMDNMEELKREPVQSISPKRSDLLNSAAKWLHQSNAKLLKSLEPLPSGVRISTLASMDWSNYNYQTFLVPRLGSSHLMLVDLVYDANEQRVAHRPARIQRIVQIQKCVNMPTVEETNFQIQDRMVRVCLFDGQKFLSNIVRIPMVPVDREKKHWQLMPQNLLRETKPNDLCGDLFVRFNYSDPNVHLLVEIGMSVLKADEGQPIELSLGWILVPFYDEKGVIVTNRTNDYLLQPGTPYEESVFAEDSVKEETLRSRVQQMFFGKRPQVTVRIGQPNREQNYKLETLPDILVGLCGYLPLMSLYWEMLGNVLFGSGSSTVKDSVYLRQVPPSCALFPYVADTPLLMEALRISWNEVWRDLPAAQKKDIEKVQKTYSEHFLRVIYPLACLLNIIPTGPTSSLVFEKKTDLVLSLLHQTQTDPIKFFMSPDYKFLAFTTREFTCPMRITG